MIEQGFHAVGLGVGSPSQVTLNARDVLESSDAIFAPRSERSTFSKARERLDRIGDFDGRVQQYKLSMHANDDQLEAEYDSTAQKIADLVDKNRTVSAVTLGDPLLYSTCYKLTASVEDYLPRNRIHFHTGVSSPQIASSLLKKKLAQSEESLALVPLVGTSDRQLELFLDEIDNLVFMKVNRNFDQLREILNSKDRMSEAHYVRDIGGEQERVAPLNSMELEDNSPDYFALLLVLSDDERLH